MIFERLSPNGQTYCDTTLLHLQEFANSGLRTLCCAMRDIAEDKYNVSILSKLLKWTRWFHSCNVYLSFVSEMESVVSRSEHNAKRSRK